MDAHLAVARAPPGGIRAVLEASSVALQRGEPTVLADWLGETTPRRLVVVLGAPDDAVANAIAELDAELLINSRWNDGLSSSLKCAARALRDHTGSVLIRGCDQPALEADHLRQLLAGAAGAAPGCRCMALIWGRRR